MTFENILTLLDKFDESSSSFLELDVEDVHLKLKKADMCKTVVSAAGVAPGFMSSVAPMPAAQYLQPAASFTDNSETESTEKVSTVNEDDLVKSPLVGVFYAAPSPEKPAFVQVGSKVEKGDTICLIESMKMMSQVSAPKSGVVKAIFVENETAVEYDTPLFEIG